MKVRIEIPVYYGTKQSEEKNRLGVPVDDSDFELYNVIFYSIDAISPEVEDGKPTGGSLINCQGEIYSTPYSKEKIESLIYSKNQNI